MAVVLIPIAALVAAGCGTNYVNPKPQQALVIVGDDVRDTNVQGVLCPGGGARDIGVDRIARPYHMKDSKRYYSVTTDEGRGDVPGPDQIRVPTADGVTAGIELILSFHTNFDCKGKGKALLLEFNEALGSRKFPILGAGEGTDSGPSAAVWQKGADGWGAFLDVEFRQKALNPVVKDFIEDLTCAQISTECAALEASQRSGQALATAEDGKRVASTQDRVEREMVEALNAQLKESMGEQYLTVTKIDIQRVNLPSKLKESIQKAQTAKADIATERAELEKAKLAEQRSELFTVEQRYHLALAKIWANGNARVHVGSDGSIIEAG